MLPLQGISGTPAVAVFHWLMHKCFKLAQCFFAGTFILVGIMLALTPKQQRWIWVLTDFNVRQLLLSCL